MSNLKTENRNTDFVKSEIRVTIGMLVSNHIQYIEKCMESLKPILEAVPSELIVVDTVGPEKTDGSLDIVKKYTDKIYRFDWCNDFSAARNVAMDHAKGEWFMYLDDDEYFDDVKEFIAFFDSEERYRYNSATYFTGDYTRPDFYRKSIAGRMVRRRYCTRFVGKIHEAFNEFAQPIKQFSAFTHHFGYLYETPEARQAKFKRNISLLEGEYAVYGPNPRLCAQIVQEYMSVSPEEGSKKNVEYIKILDGKGELDNSLGQWMLTANIRFMAGWNSLPGVLGLEKDLYERFKLSQVSKLVIAEQVADVAMFMQRYDIAADRVRTYFEMYDWLFAHPEERILQVQLDNTQFLQEEAVYAMAKTGVKAENHLRHYEKAYEYIKRMDLDYSTNHERDRKLIEWTLKELEDPNPAIEYCKRIYRDEFFTDPKLHKFLPAILRNRL